MSAVEEMLEARLDALPGSYQDYAWATVCIAKKHGLVDELLQMLDDTPNATAESVTLFECEYRGDIEIYDNDGTRRPVDPARLRLTRGMREILSDAKGKTLKSYQFARVQGAVGDVADSNVRISLGRSAIDLNCYGFAYEVGGARVELSQLLCERRSLDDDFRSWSDAPVRAYAVGERITGVELLSDHVEISPVDGGEPISLDIDIAVAVRTAHAVYTFARESWESTGIRVAAAQDVSVPPSAERANAAWLAARPELGQAKVTHTTAKLA